MILVVLCRIRAVGQKRIDLPAGRNIIRTKSKPWLTSDYPDIVECSQPSIKEVLKEVLRDESHN